MFQIAYAVTLILVISKSETRAQFGDMFGALNSLFSAFAFVAIVVTLFLQRKDLELQREQLSIARRELLAFTEAQQSAAEAAMATSDESEKHREVLVSLKHFEILNEQASLEARRVIFRLDQDFRLIEDEGSEERQKVLRFLNYLNHVGYLLNQDFIPFTPTIDLFYITTIRIWVSLEDWILKERKSKGYYLGYLQWLVNESVKHWETKNPRPRIVIARHGGNSHSIDRVSLEMHLRELVDHHSSES